QMKPEKKQIAMNEEETLVFKLIKDGGRAELTHVKEQADLSNKKWDKAIKFLTKNGLAKVEKNDEGLFVEAIG
ncbi:MAG: lysine--tRNA ligase, partial [Bacteroidota bacterium]